MFLKALSVVTGFQLGEAMAAGKCYVLLPGAWSSKVTAVNFCAPIGIAPVTACHLKRHLAVASTVQLILLCNHMAEQEPQLAENDGRRFNIGTACRLVPQRSWFCKPEEFPIFYSSSHPHPTKWCRLLRSSDLYRQYIMRVAYTSYNGEEWFDEPLDQLHYMTDRWNVVSGLCTPVTCEDCGEPIKDTYPIESLVYIEGPILSADFFEPENLRFLFHHYECLNAKTFECPDCVLRTEITHTTIRLCFTVSEVTATLKFAADLSKDHTPFTFNNSTGFYEQGENFDNCADVERGLLTWFPDVNPVKLHQLATGSLCCCLLEKPLKAKSARVTTNQ
jgi:hypothetical protein